MADHSPTHTPRGFQDHKDTYTGFINASVAVGMICLYILVALCAFAFMSNPMNVIVGFGGIFLSIILALIDLKTGAKWYLSGAVLVLYGLFVAANV
jgi:hypothetical protein